MRMSDFYIKQPNSTTPYQEPWACIAAAAYYWPLNYLRARAVVSEGLRIGVGDSALGFFKDFGQLVDFGSGLGTFSLAMHDEFADRRIADHVKTISIERSNAAINMHQQILADHLDVTANANNKWYDAFRPQILESSSSTLYSFCYSLTEAARIPEWALKKDQSNGIIILEPSTHQDSRRLMEWRRELLSEGWFIWGPCTHNGDCPLLTQSKRDWCHDRLNWEIPEWFAAIEDVLPIKNQTLTFSWLLVRRIPPPTTLGAHARLVGDLMREKGASRQLVCAGAERTFLSWQHKHGEPPHFQRGDLVKIANDVTRKANELRPTPEQCTQVVSV